MRKMTSFFTLSVFGLALVLSDAGLSAASQPVITADDASALRGFADFFSRANEPNLYLRKDINYSVRITVHGGMVDVLRIDRGTDGKINSTFKHYSFTDAGVPAVTSTVQKPLTGAQFERLTTAVQREGFFAIGPLDQVVLSEGPAWLIEVYDGKNYHAVERPVRQGNTPFGIIANVATEIAGANLSGN